MQKRYPIEGSPKMARACAASSSKMHRQANSIVGADERGGGDNDECDCWIANATTGEARDESETLATANHIAH